MALDEKFQELEKSLRCVREELLFAKGEMEALNLSIEYDFDLFKEHMKEVSKKIFVARCNVLMSQYDEDLKQYDDDDDDDDDDDGDDDDGDDHDGDDDNNDEE